MHEFLVNKNKNVSKYGKKQKHIKTQ